MQQTCKQGFLISYLTERTPETSQVLHRICRPFASAVGILHEDLVFERGIGLMRKRQLPMLERESPLWTFVYYV